MNSHPDHTFIVKTTTNKIANDKLKLCQMLTEKLHYALQNPNFESLGQTKTIHKEDYFFSTLCAEFTESITTVNSSKKK